MRVPSEPTDEVVVTTGEMERFCATAWPRLVNAMTYYCGDVYVAEELVQEALLRACRRWGTVSALQSPEGWAFRVTLNLANSVWRRKQAEHRARERHGGDDAAYRDPDIAERDAVHHALGKLSAKQREVVVLRYFLDLPFDRVAELTASSPGAVRTSASRAISQLRRTLNVTTDYDREDVRHVP